MRENGDPPSVKVTAATRPAPGEEVNGDSYVARQWDGSALLGLLDGLGHGREASEAAEMGKSYALDHYQDPLDQIVVGIHAALRGTRGAEAAFVKVDSYSRELTFCGIGNVECRVLGKPPMSPASIDGVLGLNLRKVRPFIYTYSDLSAVLLHTDGISSRFSLDQYEDLLVSPQESLARILSEHGRAYDDATIVMAIWGKIVTAQTLVVQVNDMSGVALATKSAGDFARELGFSEGDQTRISIAASELATNIVRHAKGQGKVTLSDVTSDRRKGIAIVAEDTGPGIADVSKAMEGWGGSSGGLGIGLGAVKRLMDEFSIETDVGRGTKVMARKWAVGTQSVEPR